MFYRKLTKFYLFIILGVAELKLDLRNAFFDDLFKTLSKPFMQNAVSKIWPFHKKTLYNEIPKSIHGCDCGPVLKLVCNLQKSLNYV